MSEEQCFEQFLAGLRTAWTDGEARPTANPPAKPKRERRRPDPLVKVTEQLHGWFEAEPWSTSRQLLELLQEARPGEYSDSHLRTVQPGEGLATRKGDRDGVRRIAVCGARPEW